MVWSTDRAVFGNRGRFSGQRQRLGAAAGRVPGDRGHRAGRHISPSSEHQPLPAHILSAATVSIFTFRSFAGPLVSRDLRPCRRILPGLRFRQGGSFGGHLKAPASKEFFLLKSILKEEGMESLICYCFGYTTSDIERDVVANGKSTIMDRIMSEKKAGGCQCAPKNPKGR